jgi:hypothetical protein
MTNAAQINSGPQLCHGPEDGEGDQTLVGDGFWLEAEIIFHLSLVDSSWKCNLKLLFAPEERHGYSNK